MEVFYHFEEEEEVAVVAAAEASEGFVEAEDAAGTAEKVACIAEFEEVVEVEEVEAEGVVAAEEAVAAAVVEAFLKSA